MAVYEVFAQHVRNITLESVRLSEEVYLTYKVHESVFEAK